MKKVLLYQRAHQQALREYLTTCHQEDDYVIILEVNTRVEASLRRENIATKQLEDYITDEELLAMDRAILHFVHKWYTIDGYDFTMYDGISLGEVMEFDLMVYFATILPEFVYALRVASTEQPAKLLLFEDQSLLQTIFIYVCTTYFETIEIEYLHSSGQHKDFIERQNPRFFSSQNSSTLASRQVPFQRVLNLGSRILQKCLIEIDAFIRELGVFDLSRQRTIFIHNYRTHADLIDRLRKTLRKNILSEAKYVKSDYKNIANQQSRARITFAQQWNQLKHNTRFQQFFRYPPSHLGLHTSSQSSKQEQSFIERSSLLFDFWPIIEPHLQNLFVEYFPGLVQQIELFRRWAQRHRLSLLVLDSPYGTTWCRVWLLAARQLQITTVGLMDGPFCQVASNRSRYVTPITDYIATWGKVSSLMALSQGFKEEQIRVIGEHYLEELKTSALDFDIQAMKKELGIAPDTRIITFTPSGGAFWSAVPVVTALDQEDILRTVCEAAQGLQDSHFIIKFHPWNDFYEGEGSLSKKIGIVNSYHLKNMSIISSSEKIVRFIALADVMLVLDSNTGLEAIYLEKPLIFLHFRNRRQFALDFVSSGAALGVYKPEDLVKMIQTALENPDIQSKMKHGRKTFLEEHITQVPDYEKIIEQLATFSQMEG